jgi:hypothetical protein
MNEKLVELMREVAAELKRLPGWAWNLDSLQCGVHDLQNKIVVHCYNKNDDSYCYCGEHTHEELETVPLRAADGRYYDMEELRALIEKKRAALEKKRAERK